MKKMTNPKSNTALKDIKKGTRVQIVSRFVGGVLWDGETGIVTSKGRSKDSVKVKLTEPKQIGNKDMYRDIKEFKFSVDNLKILKP